MLMGELDVMDELDFLLRTKRVEMKDTWLVPAKNSPMLKLDNLFRNL